MSGRDDEGLSGGVLPASGPAVGVSRGWCLCRPTAAVQLRVEVVPPVVGTRVAAKDEQSLAVFVADGQQLSAACGQFDRQGVDVAGSGKCPSHPAVIGSSCGQSPADDPSLSEQSSGGDDHGQGAVESMD